MTNGILHDRHSSFCRPESKFYPFRVKVPKFWLVSRVAACQPFRDVHFRMRRTIGIYSHKNHPAKIHYREETRIKSANRYWLAVVSTDQLNNYAETRPRLYKIQFLVLVKRQSYSCKNPLLQFPVSHCSNWRLAAIKFGHLANFSRNNRTIGCSVLCRSPKIQKVQIKIQSFPKLALTRFAIYESIEETKSRIS